MLKLKEPFFNAWRIGTILFLSKVVRAAEEDDMNNWAVRLAGFEVAPIAKTEVVVACSKVGKTTALVQSGVGGMEMKMS
jgi:nucleoside phosphorylase